jgi:hypothetical protein
VVDFEVARSRKRPGWQELRVLFDAHNERHLRQVDRVVDALLQARRAAARENDDGDEVVP